MTSPAFDRDACLQEGAIQELLTVASGPGHEYLLKQVCPDFASRLPGQPLKQQQEGSCSLAMLCRVAASMCQE